MDVQENEEGLGEPRRRTGSVQLVAPSFADSANSLNSNAALNGDKEHIRDGHMSPVQKFWSSLMIILLISAIIFFAMDVTVPKMGFIFQFLSKFSLWLAPHLVPGSFALLTIVLFISLLGLPCSPVTILAGGVYTEILGYSRGLVVGFFVIWVSQMVACTVIYFVSHLCCGNAISETFEKKSGIAKGIYLALKKNPLKFGLILRFCALVPFSTLSYLLGSLNVEFKIFLILHFGLIPTAFFFLFTGALVGPLLFHKGFAGAYKVAAQKTSSISLLLTILLLAIFIIGMTIKARQMLKEIMIVHEKQEETQRSLHSSSREENFESLSV